MCLGWKASSSWIERNNEFFFLWLLLLLPSAGTGMRVLCGALLYGWLSWFHAWVHPHVCTGASRPNRVPNKECYLNKFVIYVARLGVSFLSISVFPQRKNLIASTGQKYSHPLLVLFPSFLTSVEIWKAWYSSVVMIDILALPLLISLKFGVLKMASELLVISHLQILFHSLSSSIIHSLKSECQE